MASPRLNYVDTIVRFQMHDRMPRHFITTWNLLWEFIGSLADELNF